MKLSPVINLKSRGFALVVTLSLMILLTVVAVGLLSISSIAVRSSGKEAAMTTARANANLAMMLALGELQKHAGPDQRVTARKDVAGGADNPHYTGVWDSKPNPLAPNAPLDKTVPIAWLVSGSDATGLPTVTVVSAANGGSEVRVPLQEVKSATASQPTGAYAYWVGDEGVKARINLESPGYRTTATAKDASYAFAGAPRAAIELMETTANPATGTVTSAWGNDLYPYKAETADKLITSGGLPLYATAGSQTDAQAATKARFHDLTPHSSSVLSNTANGGLRKDLTRVLSDPSKPGPADSDPIFPANPAISPSPTETHRLPPTWGRLREWWNNPIAPSNNPNDHWNDPQVTPKLEITPSLASSTTPPIAPAVVWAEVGFAFFSEDLSTATPPGSGYRLRMQVFPRAVLWNPYTVPMAGRSYELGIGSEITGDDPNFTFQDAVGTEICRFYTNRFSFKTSAPRRYLHFTITVPTLQPGETRVLSLADTLGSQTLTEGDNPGNYTILNTSANDWFDTPLIPARFTIPLGLPTGPNFGGSNNFYLRDTGQPPHGSNMGTIPTKIFQFSSNPINQPGITGTSSPVSLPPPGAYAPQPNFRVANIPNMDNRNPVRWLDQLNLLAPILVRHTADGTWGPFYRFGIFSSSTEKLPTVSGTDEVSLEMTATGVRATKPSPNNNPATGTPYRLALREPRLPNSGLYQSIAHLQHAPLSDTGVGPLYVAGNSMKSPRIVGTATSVSTGGATTNPLYDSSYLINQALWDQYFFSTIPTTLTAAELATPGYMLPNSRLQPLPSADPAKLRQHDTAAANLMLSGGFNINSTSEQAWRAMLGAAYDLKYNPVSGALTSTPTDPLQSKFSRFLKPLGDSADPYRGYRNLSDAQIAAMAAKMVTEVKTRGPFRSLADFVNRRLVDTSASDPAAVTGLKGAVQAAIDYATGTNAPITNTQPFNIFSPGYVTQADVLSRVGSAISARSDTFVIRTYGEARNGGTVTAKAYCEAVVQRTPDYVDPSTAPEAMPPAGSINERFGRRFTIVSFRWLSPNEI